MALKLHDANPQVVTLKSMFWRAHPEWGGFGKYASKPEFDSDVRRLVLRLQHLHHLEPTGVYGQAEWLALTADLAAKTADHFALSEFNSHDGAEMPDAIKRNVRTKLIPLLEKIRARTGGQPLLVLSGYRSPAWNRHVGGAADSYHKKGLAADIAPVNGAFPGFSGVLLEMWKAKEFGGLGVYGNRFRHVDLGPHSAGRLWKK